LQARRLAAGQQSDHYDIAVSGNRTATADQFDHGELPVSE